MLIHSSLGDTISNKETLEVQRNCKLHALSTYFHQYFFIPNALTFIIAMHGIMYVAT